MRISAEKVEFEHEQLEEYAASSDVVITPMRSQKAYPNAGKKIQCKSFGNLIK